MDPSIQQLAFNLLEALINKDNINEVIKQMLDYLSECDPILLPEVTSKVC